MPAFARVVAAACLIAGSIGLAPAARAEELPTFDVTLESGRIAPARLEVPAGRKIKLSLRNENAGPAEFEARELRIEKVLAPGARSFVVIHPLKPGTYRFFDEFHPEAPDMELVAR
jgi:hypothetical protein